MSEFVDEWKRLNDPDYKTSKERGYELLSQRLNDKDLSADEQYSVAWGPEALSEEWIKARAQKIQAEVEGSPSMAILKTGSAKTGAATDAAKTEEPAATSGTKSAASSSGSSSNQPDRTSGPYGNGTNRTDAEWDALKSLRDRDGWGNDVDTNDAKSFLSLMVGGIAGIPKAMSYASASKNALTNEIAHSSAGAYKPGSLPSGMGDDFGSKTWSDAVNSTASARLQRQGSAVAEGGSEDGTPTISSVEAAVQNNSEFNYRPPSTDSE